MISDLFGCHLLQAFLPGGPCFGARAPVRAEVRSETLRGVSERFSLPRQRTMPPRLGPLPLVTMGVGAPGEAL
jgi:hypothetical protein